MTEEKDHLRPTARRPRRVTAADVARAAGVSRTAVSRAFNPDSYLDPLKRERVLNVALDIGYRPNALAASLQGTRTGLVAVVAGDLASPYDSEFLAALVSALNAADKWPLVLGGPHAVTDQAILSVLRYPLDALIIRGGSISPDIVTTCEKLNIPIIFAGRIGSNPRSDSVACDNRAGSAKAVDLLLRGGRRRFGYLGGPADWSSERERLAGVVSRLEGAGHRLLTHGHADYSVEGGRRAARVLLTSHALDALICANDAMALGALSCARHDLGLAVPDDLAVVGFDDISMARWPEYRLTTLRNPIDCTVREVLRLLEMRLSHPQRPGERVIIAPTLIARATH
ncbi:LacI family DNA-binding transcriptional regulator [Roseobacter sinensis]|uniref:LacI family DNA-binding transcriptional regulator n=1 Tax=Roseobacter sinensis TaxID=2931391 RepID=A0ABT3BJT3_9RHOB|nr:LacI family DNA-binding transcriptional regulator [Roseobacter sp. WL0113]MCV3273832.1 LacI family DNA-binding transcriptional regulator [Roseobacter sp. WL0113]